MKTLSCIILTGLIAVSAKSQIATYNNPGDTLGPFTVISFEEPSPYIKILPLSQNIWQIGTPQKTLFNASYTLPKAIVTDTINNYPINNLSTFELIIGQFNDPVYSWNVFLDFRHKYNSDADNDGGYITVSWDNGNTWTNVVNDNNPAFMYTPMNDPGIYNHNLPGSILVNGEQGYSGTSPGWVQTSLAWYILPVIHEATHLRSDTMRLRFNFISDTTELHHEGWMIDQIRLYSIDLGSGIQEYLAGQSHSFYYPNPVNTAATFKLDRTYKDVQYKITDSKGSQVLTNDQGTCNEFIFERGALRPGIYFMRLFLDKRFIDVHRIVISD